MSQVDDLQIALEDGTYAGGRVTVQPLPEQVHGQGNLRTFSLRRIEAVVSEADAQSHIERELLKVTFRQHLSNRKAARLAHDHPLIACPSHCPIAHVVPLSSSSLWRHSHQQHCGVVLAFILPTIHENRQIMDGFVAARLASSQSIV